MGIVKNTRQKSNKKSIQLSSEAKRKALNGIGVARDTEMEQLRSELRRVSWELDFLKEATAFLSKVSKPTTRT